MSELVVVGFDNPYDADRALSELSRMQIKYLIDLEDAVVAVRRPDGKVQLKRSINLVDAGAVSGDVWGGLFGSLVGLLLMNPLADLAVGTVVGTGSGTPSGTLSEYGIRDDFIRSLADTLKPDTSAFFVLVREAQPEKVVKGRDYPASGCVRARVGPASRAHLRYLASSLILSTTSGLARVDTSPGSW